MTKDECLMTKETNSPADYVSTNDFRHSSFPDPFNLPRRQAARYPHTHSAMIGSDHRLALPAGHRFAEFRIVKVLGQGGFGITYLAQDTLLNVEVAIKELLPRDFATREAGVTVVPKRPADAESFAWAKQRFINEARILAGLRHENIVHVYRFLECHGTAYMVMEFIHGQNMLDWMRKHRKPTEQSLRSILFPLLEGLDCVHRNHVLHRDISPENILITADGRPMLLDFGAARTTVDQNKTITGVVRPGYSPVEQYQTDSPQGAFTDIYALAGVMAHAITGAVPPLSMDRCGGTDPFAPLTQRYRGKYDDTFLQALDAGFRVDPKDRPQTVAQWRQMLRGESSRGKSAIHRVPPVEKQERSDSKRTAPPPQPKPGPLQPVKRKGALWLMLLAVLAIVAGVGSLIYVINGGGDGGSSSTHKAAHDAPADGIGGWEGGEYINSLGMKFVSVPFTQAYFCATQTRRQDYAAFARENPGLSTEWSSAMAWNKVPVSSGGDEPVVMVSWNEANAFCKWLSETETKRSGKRIVYRLPNWEEWRLARGNKQYPWGDETSVPRRAGNYADAAARRAFGANFVVISNYDDGFATTSPVGRFGPNQNGLYEFASNVQEWSSEQDLGSGEMLILGASWKDASLEALACREKPQYHESADSRQPFVGFRCVLFPPR